MASGSTTCRLLSPSPWLLISCNLFSSIKSLILLTITPETPYSNLSISSPNSQFDQNPLPLFHQFQTPMASSARKLLLAPEHGPLNPFTASSPDSHSGISSNILSALIRTKSNEDYSVSSGVTTNSYGGFSGYRLNPPFDTSMALTALVLLLALFFMGFFSIYIRRFANESSVDPTRFRRRLCRSSEKGVDPETVDSLPEYSYGVDAKQGIIDCAICLSELEEGEVVKVIPYCGHVFHADCIEMWLASHLTCPLCRTAKLLPAAEENSLATEPGEVRVSIGCDAGGGETVGRVGSTVDGRDTWSEDGECVGPGRLRRSSSCSLVCERVVLRRSLSF